ncbi:MAG: hypothetical protein ACYDG5_04650 [Dehalococcoidales bacterium]
MMCNNKLTKEQKQQQRDDYIKTILGDETKSLIFKKGPDKKTKTVAELEQEKEIQEGILSKELERLSNLASHQANSIEVTKDCNKLLDETRTLLTEESPNTNTILSKFNQTKQRLIQAYDSRFIYHARFGWLLGYNFVVFIGIALTIGFCHLVPGQEALHNTAWVLLACALWGGGGGVADALYSMHTHFAKQDFDKKYLLWYYLHPFLGVSFGAVVYLVLQAGLLSISGTSLNEAGANVSSVVVRTRLFCLTQ